MMHARPSATALEELILEHERWAGTLSGTGRQLVLEDTDLAGVDLAGRDLTEVYLGGSRLVGARLVGTATGRHRNRTCHPLPARQLSGG
jgi:uncharacterized protein YjbI with pentapeptide repeats